MKSPIVAFGYAFRVGVSVAAAPGSCLCARCGRIVGLGCSCAVEASSRKKFELPSPRPKLTPERISAISSCSTANSTHQPGTMFNVTWAHDELNRQSRAGHIDSSSCQPANAKSRYPSIAPSEARHRALPTSLPPPSRREHRLVAPHPMASARPAAASAPTTSML
jgi:hypothetical protein